MIAIPMIDSRSVGVKLPVTGTGRAVAVGVAISVGMGVGVAVEMATGIVVGVGLTTGVGVGVVPDGEATKAGASPAWTIKSLVRVWVIPEESTHEIVIECAPEARFVGGLQLQEPLVGILTDPETAASE
jgi:hypothetical protein